jgi:uncharacterized damage-inducible protein DinB
VSEVQAFDPDTRTEPPLHGDEVTILRSFLDYHRDTFRWKCSGLTHEQLAVALPPSDMTLGGMMKHLAIVESSWFERVFDGGDVMPPFDTVDRVGDWDWHSAADDTPAELRAYLDEAARRADAVLDQAVSRPEGLDAMSAQGTRRNPEARFSLRFILVHMVEEYSRHNGHADLIRQSIDGQTGE